MLIDWERLRNKIPNKIHIRRGAHYEIVWTEKDAERGIFGETRFNTRQIVMELGHSAKETVHTYLHELAHAVSAEYEIGLTETQVRKFEQAVYYLLKDNNIFKD